MNVSPFRSFVPYPARPYRPTPVPGTGAHPDSRLREGSGPRRTMKDIMTWVNDACPNAGHGGIPNQMQGMVAFRIKRL